MIEKLSKDSEILILGAGPAGLTAGLELTKAQKKVIFLEKQKEVGGLAKTLKFGEFKTDIGPHRFFSKNQRLYDLISGLLGEDWQRVKRLTRFYINGKFFLYPVQLGNALRGVGPMKAFRILFDYFEEKLKSFFRKPRINSFKDYAIANFGRTLAEFNMINYTEKIWGISASQISYLQGQQRLKSLSFWETFKKAIRPSGQSKAKTLVDEFYYPRYGTGSIYHAMEKIIQEKGNEIKLTSYPLEINHSHNKIVSVKAMVGQSEQVFEPGFLINTIPLDVFVRLLNPAAPEEILSAIDKLRYRDQVYLFITLHRPRVGRDNWIYFHEKQVPFGRLMEPKNFSEQLSPPDKTSLFIEFFVFKNEPIWQMGAEELLDLSAPYLEKALGIKRSEIIDAYIYKQEKVYPIYEIDYEKNLKKIMDYLNEFSNLLTIGRPGRFQYNNQDHSLEMGLLAAQSIIDNKKYDIEKIGSEKEYFEKGQLQ